MVAVLSFVRFARARGQMAAPETRPAIGPRPSRLDMGPSCLHYNRAKSVISSHPEDEIDG